MGSGDCGGLFSENELGLVTPVREQQTHLTILIEAEFLEIFDKIAAKSPSRVAREMRKLQWQLLGELLRLKSFFHIPSKIQII